MKPLAPGDPVTVIYTLSPDGRTAERYVRAVEHDGDAFTTGRGRYLMSTEGVRWIRGHHTEDSPEGHALIAAAILTLD